LRSRCSKPNRRTLPPGHVRIQTSAPVPVPAPVLPPVRRGYVDKANPEVSMLLALAVVLLIIAVAGGVVIHPLLFLIAILALIAFFSGRRGIVP
jgi:hypothetical protein